MNSIFGNAIFYFLAVLFVIAILFYIYWETLFHWKENIKRNLREILWKYVKQNENQENGVLSTSTDSPLQEMAYYLDTHFLSPSELPIPIDNQYLDEDEDSQEGFEGMEEEGFEGMKEEGFEEEEEGMEEEKI
jgi:hypothetical protein